MKLLLMDWLIRLLNQLNKMETKFKTLMNISTVRNSALEWWGNLSSEKQREYELNTFGDGEYWEDNDTLEPEDIIKIYQQYNEFL